MIRFAAAFALLFAAIASLALLAGCVGASQSSQIEKVLTQLGNTLADDLAGQKAVALAATPPDTDGAACADAGMQVATAIQKVAAVTAGTQVGALTLAEIGTLYQPGSAQFNWAVKTLETGCIAKVHDVNQAINSTAGIIAALPQVLVLAAAPAGA